MPFSPHSLVGGSDYNATLETQGYRRIEATRPRLFCQNRSIAACGEKASGDCQRRDKTTAFPPVLWSRSGLACDRMELSLKIECWVQFRNARGVQSGQLRRSTT